MGWFRRLNLEMTARLLWALVLLALPVTSFRYLPFLGANTQVRPLSFLPALPLLLVLAWLGWRERRLRFWEPGLLPLLAFCLLALVTSAAGYFLAPPELYGSGYLGRTLRAWVTLAGGLLFLLVSLGMNRSEADLKFTLKWLFAGFALQAFWSFLQFTGLYLMGEESGDALLAVIDRVQKMLFFTHLALHERLSGLALEPSWLAAQLSTIYIPWAFASLLSGYAWQPRRWLVPLALAGAGLLLVFTFSRSGILICLAALGLTSLVAGWGRLRLAWAWLLQPFHRRKAHLPGRTRAAALRLMVAAGLFGLLAAGGFLLARNHYFAALWQVKGGDLVSYFVNIYAGPRLAYAWAGWEIFSQHPLGGVGLGAAGFYMNAALPDWAHFNLSEIAILLSPQYGIFPNIKNLYLRLLAETGLFGFILFLSFYLLVLGRALHLLASDRREQVFAGMAGLFSWLVIAALGFSQDSFAMPIIWLPLGIVLGLSSAGGMVDNPITNLARQAESD